MVSPNACPSIKLETARTFVPGWWTHAFEMVSRAPSQLPGDVRLCYGGLLPRFTSQELSILAVLLGEVQRQLLENETAEFVELDWTTSQKQLSGIDHSAKERLAGVFESLSQIRFPIENSTGERVCYSLFDQEQWVGGAGVDGPQKLRLRPTNIAFELLGGYTDAHMDLVRRLTGGPSVASINRGRAPLVLWTPVWLELSMAEQLVYARMEAAMQDESAWLRLDGLVGAPLEELTDGVKLPKKVQDQTSPLMERLRLVGKLGRRLTAHGVIQREPSHGYAAIENQSLSQSPLLVWQATAERLRSRAESEYFGLASARVLKSGLNQQIGPILAAFSAITPSSKLKVTKLLEAVWQSISNIPGCALVLESGMVAQAHMIFIEWVARSQPESLISLPEKIQKNAVFKLISDVTAQNSAQKFREFLAMMGRSDDLRLLVKTDGSFTIAYGPISPDIENICRKAAVDYQAESKSTGVFSAKNELKTELKASSPVPVNPGSVKLESQKPTKQVTLAQNLRRLAQDELDKMMRQSPHAYADLKQKYIASLDDETKSLVLDVQRRMGSTTFDRHLRIRLVHYMVEHPSSWNSVSISLPS